MNEMTDEEKKLAFIAFCVEEYKTQLGTDGRKVIDLFEKYGVTDYLVRHYDILHSTGRNAILADIDEFIRVRSKKK